jgi:sterol 3beta-glucosyltransferase
MRVGVQAWGSEGDIRPFLALGGGLARAGHDVTLVLSDLTGRRYDRYASLLGVTIRMVAEPPPSRATELDVIGARLIASSPFEQGKLVVERFFQPAVPEMFAAAKDLVAASDLVVGHYFHYPVRTAAAARGVPEVSVTLAADVLPSGSYPPAGVPAFGALWNRAWWSVAQRAMRRMFLPSINELRKSAALPPLRSVTDAWHSRLMDLVAVSPSLVAREADWDPRHRLCGVLKLTAGREGDALPPEVEAFLSSGDAPVYVGFGSLTPTEAAGKRELRALVESALTAAGGRGIVQGVARPDQSTDAVLHVDRLPHAAVFGRCAVLVHHGGAGTTHTAVAAGIPNVVVPHVADQFWWAALLHRRGVAPPPLRRRELSAERLAQRIDDARSSVMRARAADLGRALSAEEDGVAVAVRLLQQLRV